MTPLEAIEAVEEGDTDGVVAAVAAFSDDDRFDVALAAVQLSRAALVRELLDSGVDPNFRSGVGFLLPAAASVGSLMIVQSLLERGADPSLGVPLVKAAGHGHLQVVELLLRAGADPNQGNPGFPTALGMAEQFGHASIASLLRERGASHPDQGFLPKLFGVSVDLQGPLTELADFVEDLVGGLGPGEGLAFFVVHIDVLVDGFA